MIRVVVKNVVCSINKKTNKSFFYFKKKKKTNKQTNKQTKPRVICRV